MKERNKVMLDLYKKGIKLAEIGRQFGISRQRVWELVKRNYQDNNTDKQPRCMIKRPIKSEEFVHNKLKELGIKFEICGYNEYYDLNINGKKVEIKYSSKPIKIKIKSKKSLSDGFYYYHEFHYLKPKYMIDYFIFVCGELGENTKCYIFPSSKIKNNKRIQSIFLTNKKYKDLEYLENWNFI